MSKATVVDRMLALLALRPLGVRVERIPAEIECYIGSRYNVGRDTVVPGSRY
jgi:hypothetical protein